MNSTFYDKEAKLWYGRDIPPLYNPEISVAQALIRAMIKFSPQIAQISDDDGCEIRYGEILTKTVRAAQNLQTLGYKPSQVFGFMGRNSRFVTPIIIASMAIGCPIHMIDPLFSKAELMYMLKITTPVLMFCDKPSYGLLKSCLDELQMKTKVFTYGGSEDDSEPVENLFRETFREFEFIPVKVDGPNDTALIICTSGSTDLPKGVCISHAALLNGLSQVTLPIHNVIGLSCMPIRGLSGITTLLAGILHGAPVILVTGTLTPEHQLYLIEKYKVTHMLAAPHQVILMMNSDRFAKTDLSSLKFVAVGGDIVPLHLKNALQKHLPNGMVFVGMAMSELGGIATEFPPSRKDTVGKLVDGNCAKIIDEDGNRCGLNVEGELYIKTQVKFLGYFGNQQATDEAFDEDGFFKTGDIGHFDDDGYLHIVDRKKSLLKYCITSIYPSTIESFLTESPEIKAACVVGMTDPKGMGSLVTAVVVRAEGSNISERTVYDMVAGHFSENYKLRGGVYFVDALPLTSTDKVLRRKVKETAIKMYNARSESNQFI